MLYIIEDMPKELKGKHLDEIDLVGWLNDKLKDGKQFCCFLPKDDFILGSALFLADEI